MPKHYALIQTNGMPERKLLFFLYPTDILAVTYDKADKVYAKIYIIPLKNDRTWHKLFLMYATLKGTHAEP